jgi:hypothetical protein
MPDLRDVLLPSQLLVEPDFWYNEHRSNDRARPVDAIASKPLSVPRQRSRAPK